MLRGLTMKLPKLPHPCWLPHGYHIGYPSHRDGLLSPTQQNPVSEYLSENVAPRTLEVL